MLKLTSTDRSEHGIPFTLLKDPNDVYNTAYQVQCQY